MRACVRVCVRACVCACVCVCVYYHVVELGLRGEEGRSFEARQRGGEVGGLGTIATVQSVQQGTV